MRWNSAHVGNMRQVPIGDQETVNDELKVPDLEPDIPPEPEPEPEATVTSTPKTTTTSSKA